MHIHILGICGTFMGSLAVLAKQLGYRVTGSDQNVYPPMSTQLESQGITLCQGYDPAHLQDSPDLVVIGNTCSRGNPAVEYVLDQGLPYCSGPQWLAEHVLHKRWVLAVAGTHGKTTTSSMLTWILQEAGFAPGYLIGGVPQNMGTSADLGESDFFVIEADEYDSAFFDKRSKFIHYCPRTAILGNLEFDHADIFDSLADIQRQFQHFLRTIPGSGLVIAPAGNDNLQQVFDQGLWSELQRFSLDQDGTAEWQAQLLEESGTAFRLSWKGGNADVEWSLRGRHNVQNAVAAAAAAAHVGVSLAQSCAALSSFSGVKRRLELIADTSDIKVYDDFAHHPTAIHSTLQGMRASLKGKPGRLIAIIEARSNTMKMGYHQNSLAAALAPADQVYWYRSDDAKLDLQSLAAEVGAHFHSTGSVEDIISRVLADCRPRDHIVIMSNGGFEGLHGKLVTALEAEKTQAGAVP